MATLQGTAIKTTGYLDKVYFNTSLSIEEVVSMLEKLDYDQERYYICNAKVNPYSIHIYVERRIEDNGTFYTLLCFDTAGYYDVKFNDNPFYFDYELPEDPIGWVSIYNKESFGNPVKVKGELQSVLGGDDKVGSQNELLKNLISSTPFEVPTLDEFLTGIGDAIREVKGTTDKINALTYEDKIRGLKSEETLYTNLNEMKFGAGYTLTLNVDSAKVTLNNADFTYSLDSGATWNQYTSTTMVLEDVTKIMFSWGVGHTAVQVGTTSGGSDIVKCETNIDSDDIILTEDTVWYVSSYYTGVGGGAD